MSRWMMPFWWACCTAWQTGTNSSSRWRSGSCCSSQYSVIGTPLTSSMTKYGRPAVGRAGVEHFGDVRMVHHRQRLPLGLEAGDHLPRVHARLDDLQRDRPLDRLGLLGHEDDAHAAFADLLQQLVRADDRAGALRQWRLIERGVHVQRRGASKKAARFAVDLENIFTCCSKSASPPQLFQT